VNATDEGKKHPSKNDKITYDHYQMELLKGASFMWLCDNVYFT
jgi:hypothetical protein